MKTIIGLALLVSALIVAMGMMAIAYNYNWNIQCRNAGGFKMLQAGSASRICVRQPVQMITIVARPW